MRNASLRTAAPLLAALDHLVLRVNDVTKMRYFYTEVLGLTVERELTDLGLIQLRAGQSLLDLVPVDKPLGQKGGKGPGPEGHNVDHFCWTVSSFNPQAITDYFQSHGITVGPVERRYGAQGYGPSIYLNDPEGNTIELKGPPET